MDSSYVDYDVFLDGDFHPARFANQLVVATNDGNEATPDLTAALSRVLFDAQEVDATMDDLVTRTATHLLAHTRRQNEASERLVRQIGGPLSVLHEAYQRLDADVVQRYAEAEEVRAVATRVLDTLRIGRPLARCLQLGRQLESQYQYPERSSSSSHGSGRSKRDEFQALVPCAHTLVSLREILDRREPGEEGYLLDRIDAIRSLQETVIRPIEENILTTVDQYLRALHLPLTATFAQTEEAKSCLASAAHVLLLLSPTTSTDTPSTWQPRLFVQSVEMLIRGALQEATASWSRGLGQVLPVAGRTSGLDRAVDEIAATCQKIALLEYRLGDMALPKHPLVESADTAAHREDSEGVDDPEEDEKEEEACYEAEDDDDEWILHPVVPPSAYNTSDRPALGQTFLDPLLARFDTTSLVSYFWRTLAASLATRTQDVIASGTRRSGAGARSKTSQVLPPSLQALRSRKEWLATEALPAMVVGGSRLPEVMEQDRRRREERTWDREVAVIVASCTSVI